MHRLGKYNAHDRMSDMVCENYSALPVMSRFGIALGFGDSSIGEVCAAAGVDTDTFLTVVNLLSDDDDTPAGTGYVFSVEAVVRYLHNSHDYFLNFRLPAIRRMLIEAIDCRTDASLAILRYYDEYVEEVEKHMRYEETTVFPYVESLLAGSPRKGYSIDVFRSRHDQVEARLTELKHIIIKYYPAQSSNALANVMHDIFVCEKDLASHNYIEDNLFIPAVEELETKRKAAR